MSTPVALDLRADLDRLQEEALRRRFDSFPPRTMTWVAALPAWTTDFACALGLSSNTEAAANLIRQLKAAGLIETRKIIVAGGKLTESFWLRASLRPELGRYLQESSKKRLDKDLNDLSKAVDALDLGSVAADSLDSADWVKIIQEYWPDSTGLKLIDRVDRLVTKGHLSAASSLVAGARGVGELASQPLLDAARRAQWRIDRAARIEQDRERLRYYCPRAAIEQAIEDLMLNPGQTWALHLLGDGGVGKTMLVRYLASGRFAEARSRMPPFCVARADFDHLDLKYPEQRPAELLLALASELAPLTRTREVYGSYRRFQDAADVLHEVRAKPHYDDDRARDLLEKAAGQFAQFVNRLNLPVLLVLDTCEELAKLYTPGTSAPAIDETFRLLEMTRRQAPGLRVLFAGRRWLVPAADPRQSASGPLLQPRPYLRVLPVAGFTRAEAEAYIDTRQKTRLQDDPGSEPLRPALRSALLKRSAQQASGGYNPFELQAYCEWALSDPGLDAKRLRATPGDPYVELRIIGRLGDDQVRGALGIAAELGRFDQALVTPALTRAGTDAKAAFDGLAAQEWVNVLSLGASGGPEVIEIDDHLRERIRKITAASPDRFPLDRMRLGQDARQVIGSTPLGDLPAETVEAAVRLLPVAAAAGLWQQIEDRIGEEHAWGWAAQITSRVGAVELSRAEQSGAGSPTILAAILATQASARVQTQPTLDPSLLWRAVEREVDRHPDDEIRAVLRLRARLGRLAAGDLADTAVLCEALQTRAPARDLLAGAIVAAAQGCMARGEALPGDVTKLLEGFAADAEGSSAGAVAHLVVAVLQLWAGSGAAAAAAADGAIEVADQAACGPDRHWADWVAPRRLTDRCRLVRMIIAWRCGEALDAVPWQTWRTEALEHAADVDSERLVAATIRFELSHRLVPAKELERLGKVERYRSQRRSSAWIHHQVEPLIVELAQAWSVLGEPDRSAGLLHERLDAAVNASDDPDPDTIEACELALLRLCRRQRTTSYSSSVYRLSQTGTLRLRSEAWAVLTLVDGKRPESPEDAGSWSVWWQCQDTESLTSRELDPPTPPSAADAADRAEFADCFPGLSGASASRDGDGDGSAGAPHDFDPVGELRAGREPALAPGALGRAAVSAAELTALRFPERAVSQLTDAARRLRAAGDELAAEEATLLAGLAAARCQDRPAAEAAWSSVQQAQPAHLTALLHLAEWAGWQQRAEAMIAYLDRRPPEGGLPPSPEITLPATDERRSLRSLVSRGEAAYSEAAAVGGGVVLAAGIATAGAVDLSAAAGTALILVLIRTIFVWVGEPYRLRRARKIRVSQTEPGWVAAESVPSRGVRDLRGLGLATIGGAIAGRWPFWSMFYPWHGRWAQAGPADPGPGFDLDGLRLPRRSWLSRLRIIESRLSRLTMIEIAMDDVDCFPLPWEQWLNASASADQAPTLLWFRRFGGGPPALRGKHWEQAGAVYRGPEHLAPDRERPAEAEQEPALRMLHVVGTPVPTDAGWRLRVAETRARVSTASRRKGAGEELLSMARFPLNRTALAVLQADPVDGPPQSLADQRSGFMGCARDLLDGGVGAVLVIPPLPDVVGGEAIQTAWHMVANRRSPRSPTQLLLLLAHVKRLVAAAEAEMSSGERAVSDVVLFLRAAVEAGADRPVAT